LENELAPYYEEALRMPGGAKNPKLFDGAGLKKVTQKLGMDDKLTPLVAIYFREENVTKKDPYL
jgi:hypothetical protein